MRLRSFLVNALLLIMALLMLLPLYWLLTSSIKPRSEILTIPVSLIPRSFTLENYHKLFSETLFLRSMVNSIIISGTNILLQVSFSAMAGFAFAQYQFRGKRLLFVSVVAGAMLPVTAQLVPNYIIMARLKWLDTWFPLIIPPAANAIGVLWMRQYMLNLPSDVLNAARLDGLSEFGLFWRMVVPLARPGLIALSLFIFVTTWNEFLLPLVYLRTRELYTVQIMISSFFRTNFQQNWDLLMSASVLSLVPLAILFIVLQRQFLAGMRIGSWFD